MEAREHTDAPARLLQAAQTEEAGKARREEGFKHSAALGNQPFPPTRHPPTHLLAQLSHTPLPLPGRVAAALLPRRVGRRRRLLPRRIHRLRQVGGGALRPLQRRVHLPQLRPQAEPLLKRVPPALRQAANHRLRLRQLLLQPPAARLRRSRAALLLVQARSEGGGGRRRCLLLVLLVRQQGGQLLPQAPHVLLRSLRIRFQLLRRRVLGAVRAVPALVAAAGEGAVAALHQARGTALGARACLGGVQRRRRRRRLSGALWPGSASENYGLQAQGAGQNAQCPACHRVCGSRCRVKADAAACRPPSPADDDSIPHPCTR
jgi:hypothetical protein